ncbi:MAG TPA: cupredoxin domain-containing protein [Solirubrobacterales bacterium]|nr:cupredoxin domain-containing protein [Solirubrobacterales bacterium]
MRLRFIPVAVLAALALSLAACGGDGDTTVTETQTAPAETTESTQEDSTEDSTGEDSTESETAPSGEAEGSEKVNIVEFTYQPDPVVIRTGGKVIWQNDDTAPHTATADDGSFDTGNLLRGKIKSETFKEAGTYPYFCAIHPTMHGTVEVVDKD